MYIACPACGKKDASTSIAGRFETTATGDTCGRCGCDLSALRDVRNAAWALLVLAKTAMADGAWAVALAHATRSWALARSSRSARLACLAAAAVGDADSLTRWRARLASRVGSRD